MKINGGLILCENCRCPLIMESGVSQTALEFFQYEGKTWVVPHADGCESRHV